MKSSFERELRNEHRELKKSPEFFNKQFEDVNANCFQLQQENAELKEKNESLSHDWEQLKKQVLDQEERTVNLEKCSRNKNIEIKGVPVSDNEDLPAILNKIWNGVKEPIEKADIEICHHVHCKDKSQQNIILQLRDRAKREKVLESARKTLITTDDLGFTDPADKATVYVNEHLCPAPKKLFGMTVEKEKDKGWRTAWARHIKIFARKTETSHVLRVTCVADLAKIE